MSNVAIAENHIRREATSFNPALTMVSLRGWVNPEIADADDIDAQREVLAAVVLPHMRSAKWSDDPAEVSAAAAALVAAGFICE